MSAKLSKKDQDVEQVARDAEALAQMAGKKSQHFTPGSFVLMNNRRGEILSHTSFFSENCLLVQWEDGSIENIKPIALNR